MPPLLLADAAYRSDASSPDGAPVERIRWLECFTDKEHITNFCEATDPSGNLESNSSGNHKDYQDRLRTIALREEGRGKAEIAEALGRPISFVQTWWKKEPKQVPRPPGVHEYLKPEFWRDIEIVRGFAKGLGVYEDALQSNEWVQPMADGREFRNGGGYRLKYDKEGRMRPQGNQHAKDGVLPGKLPKLDKAIQRLMVTQGIDDRVLKRPGLLWYPDGNSDAIVHRHEAWTALMSFGAPRILTIDNQPVLLRDGDLILFGTQRHGVPKMCSEGSSFDEYGGRMSVVLFFMPTGQQAQGSAPWRAITDEEPSRKMTAMLRDASLGKDAQLMGLEHGSKSTELKQLTDLGFDNAEATAALKATNFNVEMAVEALLNGSGPALLLEGDSDVCNFSRSSQIAALYQRLGDLHATRRSADLCNEASSSSKDLHIVASEDDALLAARLQNEEEKGVWQDASSNDWEERAILEQLEELEREETRNGSSQQALAVQFAQYEEMLDAKDAEEWDGRGDLMVREWRRQHLHIEQQEPSTIYAYGCGSLTEKNLFDLLSLHSIRVLYDFRAGAEQSGPNHLKPSHLEGACKRHGLHYRHAELGRETAYGILKHMKEDEGRNLLAELVWWARRKRTAFLGLDEDWRKDPRLAIGARLREAGHTVMHVTSDGSVEEQPKELELPDFIVGEEARLRMLEKQRVAGELRRPQKSAASRSSEHVAQRLAQPQKEIDAAAELRKANTQAELCRAQRGLADLQRKSETGDSKAGLGPKLLNVNKWVKAEAVQQQENLDAGKTKDGKDKSEKAAALGAPPPAYSWTSSGGTFGGNPNFSASVSALESSTSSSAAAAAAREDTAAETSALIVDCIGCGVAFPWDLLEAGDGRCVECLCSADCAACPASAEAESPSTTCVTAASASTESEAPQVAAAAESDMSAVTVNLTEDAAPTASKSAAPAVSIENSTTKVSLSRWARRRLNREHGNDVGLGQVAAGCA